MKKVMAIYLVLAFIFVLGFFTHPSENHEIFIYSKKYFAVLIILALVFLVALPWWMFRFMKKNGAKELFKTALPSLVTLLLAYFAFHYYYYATQEHLFDPFLQMPPNEYEFSLEKDSTTLRVLCLGGSTTRNVRLDTLDRYPSQLHQILKQNIPGKKIEVLNAGMDWYTTKHSIINYSVYCRDFQPDMVVVMHGINDLYRSFSPKSLAVGEYKSDYTHFYGPSIAGAKPPSFEKVANTLLRKFWFSPTYEARDFDISEFHSLNDFEKYFSTLVEVIQNDGAKVILLSQPYFYKSEMTPEEEKTLWMDRGMCLVDGEFPDARSMALALDVYNSKVAAVSAKYNTAFAHGESALPKTLEYFVDDVHYTPKGAQKLAEVVAKSIVEISN